MPALPAAHILGFMPVLNDAGSKSLPYLQGPHPHTAVAVAHICRLASMAVFGGKNNCLLLLQAVDWFSKRGYPCPAHYNPGDFFAGETIATNPGWLGLASWRPP